MYPAQWNKKRANAIDTLVCTMISARLWEWEYFGVDGHTSLPTIRIRLRGTCYGIAALGEVLTLYIYTLEGQRGKSIGLTLNKVNQERLTTYAEKIRDDVRRRKNDYLDRILSDYQPIK